MWSRLSHAYNNYYGFSVCHVLLHSVLDHMYRVASTMAGRGLDFKLKKGLSAETSGMCVLAMRGLAGIFDFKIRRGHAHTGDIHVHRCQGQTRPCACARIW